MKSNSAFVEIVIPTA